MRQVKAVLEDADAGSGGRARLRFEPVAPEKGLRPFLSVRCNDPAAPWLGPSGWQNPEHRFLPLDAAFEGDALVLVVGPEIVDAIPEFSVVELHLPEFGVAAKLSWEGVPASYGTPIHQPPMARPVPLDRPGDGAGAAPIRQAPERAAPVLAAFVLSSARQVMLRPLGRQMTAPLPRPAPGEGVAGIPFDALARAFRGTLRIDPDGAGQIVRQDPEGAPRRLRFRVTPGGNTVVQGLDGHSFGEQIGRTGPDTTVFGLDHAVLAKALQGELLLEPGSLNATLVAASIGHDPLPEPQPRRALLMPMLGMVILICVGGATILFW